MKALLLIAGSAGEPFIREGIAYYRKKIVKHLRFDVQQITGGKGLPAEAQIRKESDTILEKMHPGCFPVLLDAGGRSMDSRGLAKIIGENMNLSRDLLFVIGGAYGVDERVKLKAGLLLSLSPLTLPHALAGLIFAEQFYRSLSILRGEPYHH